MRRRSRFAILLAAVGFALPSPAAAHVATLAGSCHFSGPITPSPPITVIPRPGAHFSYRGSGSCAGTIDGAAVRAAPIRVLFTNVATAFDTCELGPDFPLRGVLLARLRRHTARFQITVSLLRIALVGPFELTTERGGRALGTASFQPSDAAAAPKQCISTGVGAASLTASFQTISPLVGVVGRSWPRH
jgi:hypothetical protein